MIKNKSCDRRVIMNRFKLFTLLITSLICSITISVASSSNDGDNKLLLMIYMNGSNLESAHSLATKNIEEMKSALEDNAQNQNLDVLIMMGGTKNWSIKPQQSDDAFENSNLHYASVTNKGVSKVMSPQLASIGAPSTLTNFLNYAVENYPAQRYGLIFWNHGSGSVRGFGYDELFADDTNLTLAEINSALAASPFGENKKLSFVGFDACLMATLETAVTVAPYAEYMVASQELEPGEGWNYDAIFSAILNSTTTDLTRVIVNSFIEKCDSDDSATLSAVKLDAVETLNNSIGALAKNISSDILEKSDSININLFRDISKQRNISKSYGVAQTSYLGTDMVDVYDFCKNIAQAKYANLLDSIGKSLSNAVVHSRKTAKLANDNICGLSLYFPNDNINLARKLDDYYKCNFNSSYLDFIKQYTTKLLSGYGEPKIEALITGDTGLLLSTNMLLDMRELHSIILTHHNGKLVSLGLDNDGLRISNEGGIQMTDYDDNVIAKWDKRWIRVGGEVVTAYLIESNINGLLYSIPINLNGEMANMQLRYDISNIDGIIDGAITILDSTTPSKGVIELKSSDKITILHELFNSDDDKPIEYIEAGTLSAENLAVQLTTLPQGSYQHGFCIEDVYGRKYYTPFVDYSVE